MLYCNDNLGKDVVDFFKYLNEFPKYGLDEEKFSESIKRIIETTSGYTDLSDFIVTSVCCFCEKGLFKQIYDYFVKDEDTVEFIFYRLKGVSAIKLNSPKLKMRLIDIFIMFKRMSVDHIDYIFERTIFESEFLFVIDMIKDIGDYNIEKYKEMTFYNFIKNYLCDHNYSRTFKPIFTDVIICKGYMYPYHILKYINGKKGFIRRYLLSMIGNLIDIGLHIIDEVYYNIEEFDRFRIMQASWADSLLEDFFKFILKHEHDKKLITAELFVSFYLKEKSYGAFTFLYREDNLSRIEKIMNSNILTFPFFIENFDDYRDKRGALYRCAVSRFLYTILKIMDKKKDITDVVINKFNDIFKLEKYNLIFADSLIGSMLYFIKRAETQEDISNYENLLYLYMKIFSNKKKRDMFLEIFTTVCHGISSYISIYDCLNKVLIQNTTDTSEYIIDPYTVLNTISTYIYEGKTNKRIINYVYFCITDFFKICKENRIDNYVYLLEKLLSGDKNIMNLIKYV